MLLTVIEIALFLVLPLLLFYQRSGMPAKKYVLHIVAIYLLWYVSYALLHELLHWFGVWVFGKTVFDYRLIPPFWRGEFGVGYIQYNYQKDRQDFVIILLPYLKDVVFAVVGLFLLKKIGTKRLFLTALLFTFFILSSLFDIGNNYFGFLIGSLNDFNAMRESGTLALSHAVGITFFVVSLVSTILFLRKTKAIS
jgi:hypothetical protein